MIGGKLKWTIEVKKVNLIGQWSIGAGISHLVDETYLFLNLIFITVFIGRMYVEVQE